MAEDFDMNAANAENDINENVPDSSPSDAGEFEEEKDKNINDPLPEPDADGWIQITKDGGIKKKILVEGQGNKPKHGADVFCHYVGTLVSNGEKFDSSRDRNEPFNFPIGQGRVIRGWDIGIATLKKGEKAILRCREDYAYGDQATGSIPPKSDLDFEVELLDWSDWKRVQSKDDFRKQIIVEGEGKDYDNPQEDAICKISYIIQLNDSKGNIILEQKEPIDFIIDDNDLFPQGFHDAIKDMKKKSQVEFIIDAQYMWKDNPTKQYNIPPNSTIYCNITLHDFQNPKGSHELNANEKYELAQKNKVEGNESFKQEKYQRAIKKYKKSLDLANDLNTGDSNNDENENDLLQKHSNEIKELKINCNNNLAMAYIKIKDYSEAINKCNDTLSIDSNNIKAFTRRGHVQFLNGNYEEAIDDFKQALNFKPNEQETKYITQFCNQAKQKIKDYQQKQKQIYSKMFKK